MIILRQKTEFHSCGFSRCNFGGADEIYFWWRNPQKRCLKKNNKRTFFLLFILPIQFIYFCLLRGETFFVKNFPIEKNKYFLFSHSPKNVREISHAIKREIISKLRLLGLSNKIQQKNVPKSRKFAVIFLDKSFFFLNNSKRKYKKNI